MVAEAHVLSLLTCIVSEAAPTEDSARGLFPDGWALTAGVSGVRSEQWASAVGSQRISVEGSAFRDPLGVTVGAGWLTTPDIVRSTAFELFVQGRLCAPFSKAWRPGVGLELGLTGLHRPAEPAELAEPPVTSPVYVTSFAEPLRFRFGPLYLSALELGFGSNLARYGRSLRLQATWLRVGTWQR